MENEKSKVLLIDFDLEEKNIKTILKLKKKQRKIQTLKDRIININKNLDVICDLDSVFIDKNNIDFANIQDFLKEFKKEYDLIIIDTSAKLENNYTRKIFYNSDKVFFLMEPNILGIKKAQDMLEVFEKDWKISNKRIQLVLNKTNMYQISDSIIKELFPDMQLIGKIKYNDLYNLAINKDICKKEIKKEYQNIQKSKLFSKKI